MKRKRISNAERAARQQQALSRATGSMAMTNYPAIFAGFMDMGIPESDILPRENIFTFEAWKALGRHVRRGQHGVKVLTWIDGSREVTDKDTGESKPESYRFCRTTTVFHVSQTDANESEVAA